MNIMTVLVAGIIGLLIIIFFISLLAAIFYNMEAAKKYRQKIAGLLSSMRLNSMLTALGVDTDKYLHTINLVDVHEHMSRCKACENTDRCDDELQAGTTSVEEISYCNNEKELKNLDNII